VSLAARKVIWKPRAVAIDQLGVRYIACCDIATSDLHWRSDQKVEYFPLSASSSTTTSNLLPTADNAETKLRRARNRPRKKERIVSEVCCVVLLEATATATLHGNIRSATKATWSACSPNAASPELRPCQETPLAELETTDREREHQPRARPYIQNQQYNHARVLRKTPLSHH
jgi:hypothetical protein